VQKLWKKIHDTGDLYKKKYQGFYCVGCEAFVMERELTDGKCQIHQKEPEKVDQENWFFRLSKYSGEIESAIKSDKLKVVPESRKNEILSFIQSGLEDVSFSRPKKDLQWGIQVPNDPDQVMYVWCDALSNYVTAIGYADESSVFKKLWPADLQVIGKDILRFHAAIWPGMLLSAGLPLPKSLFVHGFITVEGQKMSKTIGNIIDPVELSEKYGSDAVRYYLLREISTSEDGDYGKKKFEERYNADLANGIGNLVSRVATLGERITPVEFDFEKDVEASVKKECERVFGGYEKSIGEIKLNDALAFAWELVSFSDRYINDKKPWAVKDQEEFRKIIANVCYLIGIIGNLSSPFIPEAAEKISGQISYADSCFKIKKGATIFPRL
jgi:methionyl-tRNA synthetase